MAKYKVYPPDHYPIAWITATLIAAEGCDKGDPWISATSAPGQSSAVERMKRLRTFRDGLYPLIGRYPVAADRYAEGYRLAFRKVKRYGVWDVQLAWLMDSASELREIAGEILESDAEKN